MRKLTFGIPGVYEDFEACREMASEAFIERTYFVTSPRSTSNDTLHVTRSLSTAYELWTGSADRRFSVAFRWSIGDESGVGSIRYGELNATTFPVVLTESTVRDLVVQEIANKLFEGIPQLETV